MSTPTSQPNIVTENGSQRPNIVTENGSQRPNIATENGSQRPNQPTHITDFFADCKEFATTVSQKTGKPHTGKVNREFIIRMVMDELEELKNAQDETEEVDALLDAAYYIFDHLAKTGLDIRPVWKLIHEANMSKFGPGGYISQDGKWMKPPGFVPPDDKIREEIKRQRNVL
jgi:predicted HAD superfamily Cof-like phosphohydrolase